jgi:hypothetical protein
MKIISGNRMRPYAVRSAATLTVARQLFPDHATFKREENHRWELIEAHWDLPIREVDPHATDD